MVFSRLMLVITAAAAALYGSLVAPAFADTLPTDTPKQVARTIGKALAKARKVSDFRYEASGQMQESFERALTSQEKFTTLKQLALESWSYLDAAAAVHTPSASTRDEKVFQLGTMLSQSVDQDAKIDLGDLVGIISRVDEPGRVASQMGEDVLEQAELIAQAAPYMRPTMRLELAAEIEQLMAVATSFAPDDADLAEQAADLQPQITSAVAQIIESSRSEIAANTWPGGDDSSAIAKAGLAHLKQHGEWGADKQTPTQILKIATHGDWFVARENILGQPLAYAHPAYIAVREVSSPDGVVNILNISLVTKTPEKTLDFGPVSVSPGVKQMLQSNLP